MTYVQPKTYELLGLALAGTCMGFLLPYWVPDVVGAVFGQAAIVLEATLDLRLDHLVGLGFWLGTLLVIRGFVGRWRDRRIGGGEQ